MATYLAALATAGEADSTIARHAAAIAWMHGQKGLVTPQARDGCRVIADMLAGIRREPRGRPSGCKVAITATQLLAMIGKAAGEGARAILARAILALGLAAALRRRVSTSLLISVAIEGLKLVVSNTLVVSFQTAAR